MLGLAGHQATTVVGVDVGTCSLRAAQLQRDGRRWRVHHWVNLEIEPESAEAVAEFTEQDVRLAFGSGTFKGSAYAILIGPPHVEYQLLDLPRAILDQPVAQLKTALEVQLGRQTAWPMAESEVAAWSTQPNGKGVGPAMVVAARREAVEERLDLLGSQDLHCQRAEIVPNAMIHVTSQADDPDSDAANRLEAIFDLGFESGRLYLIHDGRPVYARVIRDGGGRSLTESLARTLHVEFAVAEKYKRVYGIQKSDRGFRTMMGNLGRITEEEMPGVLYAMLRPQIENIAHDIERSYRFVMGQFPAGVSRRRHPHRWGARLKGLEDVLHSHLGIEASLPDPEVVFGNAAKGGPSTDCAMLKPSHYAVLAPCVGLALREEKA